jgi:hypothetical protein
MAQLILARILYLPSRASLSLLRRLLATAALLAPAAGFSASIDRGARLLAKDCSPSIGFPAEPHGGNTAGEWVRRDETS